MSVMEEVVSKVVMNQQSKTSVVICGGAIMWTSDDGEK
jgi:hypothetical protein